jgi:hypothetical protein
MLPAPLPPTVNGAPISPSPNGAAVHGRLPNGKFAPGNPGGPGRRPRPTEQAYLRAMSAAVSLDDWRQITARAVVDALRGDAAARQWLSVYLIGTPVNPAPTLTAALAGELSGEDTRAVAMEIVRQVIAGCRVEAERQDGLFDALRAAAAKWLGVEEKEASGG